MFVLSCPIKNSALFKIVQECDYIVCLMYATYSSSYSSAGNTERDNTASDLLIGDIFDLINYIKSHLLTLFS